MSHVTHIALVLDLLLLAFSFGATVWFFFVQSPVLLKMWGKEKFLPVQMRLTRTLFTTLSVSVALMLAMTLVHGHEQLWTHALTAGLALFATLVNAFVVVPRALRAGGKALRQARREEDDGRSVADFASRGGGEESKVWHRLVVLFVVVMLGGLIAHGSVLLSNQGNSGVEHAHGHSHAPAAEHDTTERHPVDAATRRNIQTLRETVRTAMSEPSSEDVPSDVRAAFQRVFEECEMSGPAHDALHHFLIPVGKHVEALEAATVGEREPVLHKMNDHLGTFGDRFE